MKTFFNIGAACVPMLALLFVGCIDLQAPADEDTDGSGSSGASSASGPMPTSQTGSGTTAGSSTGDPTGDDPTDPGCETDCEDPAGHGLSGELMVFVNARLTDADAAYQFNVPLQEEGTYVGPAVYVYDPLRECDDGTNACRVAPIGNIRLDETLGDLSVGDGSLRKFTLRDLAWSESRGLWAVSFDTLNDEWGIASVDVPDWTRSDNWIGIDRYAIMPGDPQSPSTDPCYWQEGVSGLGFVGDELLLGVRGLGGSGIPNNGMVFRVALDVIDNQGHCVFPNDVSQDPHYYACDVVCQPWARFEPQAGVSGDVVADAAGNSALAMVRGEIDTVMPMDRQALFSIPAPPQGDVAVPLDMGLYAEGVPHGLDIEGLAWIGGRLFGIDVWGKIYEFDIEGQVVYEHDDLSALFVDHVQSLKVRGAARVVVP
jgi:hypothetical protein